MVLVQRILIRTLILLGSAGTLFGQESEDGELNKAADQATNPLAYVTKFQVQPNFTAFNGGGDQLDLVIRILQPTKTIGLPFIKSKNPEKVYTIYRMESPVVSQTIPKGNQSATGLADIILVDVIAFPKKWGIIGAGPALSIPTASREQLGSGKWSVGMAGTVLYKKIPKLLAGILIQQFISVGGDATRPEVNRMLFQPVINKVFNKGVFLNFSPIMIFDWENNAFNIPLGANIGKAFAKNLSMFVGPEYVVSGPGQGNFTMRLNINAMF